MRDLIQTFLDESGCNKIMEVCETEIVLERDLEELLISVGEGSRERGACWLVYPFLSFWCWREGREEGEDAANEKK